jgi:hypothetical protein
MRNDGRAKRIVTRIYRAKMAALAGIAYMIIKRNIRINGNFAVNWTKKISDFRRDICTLSISR